MPQPWPPWPEEPPLRTGESVATLFFRHEDQGDGPLSTGLGTLNAPFIAYLLQRERPWVFNTESLHLLFSATGQPEWETHMGCSAFSALLGFEREELSMDFYLGVWLNKDWATRDDRYIISKTLQGVYMLEMVKSGMRWSGTIRRDEAGGALLLADVKQVSGEPLNPHPQTVRLNLESGPSALQRLLSRRAAGRTRTALNVGASGMVSPTDGPSLAPSLEVLPSFAPSLEVLPPFTASGPSNGPGGRSGSFESAKSDDAAVDVQASGARAAGGPPASGAAGSGSADGSGTGGRGLNSSTVGPLTGIGGGAPISAGGRQPVFASNLHPGAVPRSLSKMRSSPSVAPDGQPDRLLRNASKQSTVSYGDGDRNMADASDGPKPDVLVSASRRPGAEVWSREEVRHRSAELDEDGFLGQYISDQFGVRFTIVRAGDGSILIHWLQYTAVLHRDRPWLFGHSMGADGKPRKKIRIYPVQDGSGVLHMQYLEEKKQTWVQPPTKMRPLTEEEVKADGRYVASDSLWQALGTGDTILLRGRWVMEHAETDEPLPRRQDLPLEAVWDPKELERLVRGHDVLVVAISYCWEEENHPDPYGRQLEILAGVIKERLKLKYPNGRHALMDVAIWIDWCSLHQRPYSSDGERESFERGLEDCYLWFAHQTSECWLIQTVAGDMIEYDQRGWPYFEVEISSMITPQHMLINIGKWRSNINEWFRLFQACRMDRSVPETPADFLEDLRLKTFKHPEDLSFLERKYSQVFTEVMGAAQVLSFSDITHWGLGNDPTHSDWVLLAHMLPLCQRLRRFSMVNDRMDGTSFESVAAVLPQCKSMKVLELSSNPLGDEGATALAAALPQMACLEMLVLEDCSIKEQGARALAEALPSSSTVQELWLAHNEISNGGGVAFIQVMDRCPSLRVLLLSDNKIGGQTAQRLNVAWAAAGKLDNDDEHYNLEI